MATCTVSGTLKDLSDTAISGAIIRAYVEQSVFSGTTQVAPSEISTTSDAAGAWSLVIIQTLTCQVVIEYPPNTTDSRRRLTYSITVPASTTANFSTLAVEL